MLSIHVYCYNHMNKIYGPWFWLSISCASITIDDILKGCHLCPLAHDRVTNLARFLIHISNWTRDEALMPLPEEIKSYGPVTVTVFTATGEHPVKSQDHSFLSLLKGWILTEVLRPRRKGEFWVTACPRQDSNPSPLDQKSSFWWSENQLCPLQENSICP